MGQGEQPGEDPEQSDAIERVEGYQEERDEKAYLVLFDSRNIRAWIKSTVFGFPTDRAGEHEGQPAEEEEG